MSKRRDLVGEGGTGQGSLIKICRDRNPLIEELEDHVCEEDLEIQNQPYKSQNDPSRPSCLMFSQLLNFDLSVEAGRLGEYAYA
jgi:hypothetical protein